MSNRVLKTSRISHRRCSLRKGVHRNFAKFTGKQLCQSLFSKKICRSESCNFIKKETLAQVFSCEFLRILLRTFHRTPLGDRFCNSVKCTRRKIALKVCDLVSNQKQKCEIVGHKRSCDDVSDIVLVPFANTCSK